MIELDANGRIPQLTHCRVYIVAGFTEGRPFTGFNIWTDTGPHDQAFIEAYDTFQGWATPTLDAGTRVLNTEAPTRPNEFRVGLMAAAYPGASPYPFLETGDSRTGLAASESFLGWLTQTMSVELPDPVPRLLLRYLHPRAVPPLNHGSVAG